VALGDVGALYDRVERDDPGFRLWKQVADWISSELADRPWAAPSTPMLPAEGQPTGIRSVQVPDTGITVVYQHHHESGRIDLVHAGP
jgi:hypothetical protein